MGTGVRVFLIDDNDSLQRISMARLDRLLQFKPGESFPAYADKRVRCAMVFLDVHVRKVLGIKYTDYFLIPFDTKGRIDKKEWERGIRLGMELVPSGLKEQHPNSIIDARHRFIKRRYDHEFKWKPNRKVEEAIVAAAFSVNLPVGRWT
jgi:hypothetical protein